ncbi:MAG: hypothetical protein ACTSP5_14845 [Candidatus Heimdallarchaeota archaeon]
MPKRNDKTADQTNIMAELYELSIPGQLIGKEVIDASARKIGVVYNVKLTFPPGGVVQLKETIKQAEELEIRDVARLREEIASDISKYLR